MIRKAAKKSNVDQPQDEPGAEERFRGILKKALNTPPPRKQGAAGRGAKANKRKT